MSIYSKRDEITREKEERRMSYELPEIYIVISQTGTLFSRALKVATRHPYNHVSISLDRIKCDVQLRPKKYLLSMDCWIY